MVFLLQGAVLYPIALLMVLITYRFWTFQESVSSSDYKTIFSYSYYAYGYAQLRVVKQLKRQLADVHREKAMLQRQLTQMHAENNSRYEITVQRYFKFYRQLHIIDVSLNNCYNCFCRSPSRLAVPETPDVSANIDVEEVLEDEVFEAAKTPEEYSGGSTTPNDKNEDIIVAASTEKEEDSASSNSSVW